MHRKRSRAGGVSGGRNAGAVSATSSLQLVNHVAILRGAWSPKPSDGNSAARNPSPGNGRRAFREGAPMAEPAFKLHDTVKYRWSGSGPFIGEARVIEILGDGR